MIVVKLSEDEIAFCNFLGNMRNLINLSSGTKDTKKTNKRNGAEINIDGVIGEYAFSKYFNTHMDCSLMARSGSFDGVLNKYRYDVKSTRRDDYKMCITTKPTNDVDMYVKTLIVDNDVHIIGYIMFNDARVDENLEDFGYGNTYAISNSQLTKFKADKND